jgi:outer membrane protein insertion porin family
MWSESTELQFPTPLPPDLGITGFAFVDTGSTWQIPASEIAQDGPAYDSSAPRVGAGVGIAWNTPFGLIDLSLAEPIVKQPDDQIQQFRVSFGTRF